MICEGRTCRFDKDANSSILIFILAKSASAIGSSACSLIFHFEYSTFCRGRTRKYFYDRCTHSTNRWTHVCAKWISWPSARKRLQCLSPDNGNIWSWENHSGWTTMAVRVVECWVGNDLLVYYVFYIASNLDGLFGNADGSTKTIIINSFFLSEENTTNN